MNVGKSIKVALAKRGVTQVDMAKKMGCGRVWLSRLANSRSASMNTVEELAAAFDMKVSEFVALGED
jgi:transcriptional regulator with XRE-family HTH domain